MRNLLRSFLLALLAMTSLNMAATDVDDIMKNLKARIAPDGRTAIWDVKTTTQEGVATIYGKVGTQEQFDAINQELKDNGITNFSNKVVVLQSSVPAEKRWALVKLSIASMRCEGKHAAEMATQGIMGMPVQVMELGDEWYRVVTPDHYISYCPASSLTVKTEAQMDAWRKAKRYIVTVYSSCLVTAPGGDETVTDLVLGNILEFKSENKKYVELATPDGRTGWVAKTDVAEFSEWAKQDFDAAKIEKTARRMMGSSYLWGGTSTKVTDCSGLSKVSYFSNGIILARDASQQTLTGTKIKGSDWEQCKLGDLLFFGNSKTGRVTHVGIYLRDGQFIHCSGQVKINSLKEDDPTYLYSALSCSRIDGMMGTPGITQVRNHPWYFPVTVAQW